MCKIQIMLVVLLFVLLRALANHAGKPILFSTFNVSFDLMLNLFSLLVLHGHACLPGSRELPEAWSSRSVLSTWWLTCMILTAAYSANMAAQLSVLFYECNCTICPSCLPICARCYALLANSRTALNLASPFTLFTYFSRSRRPTPTPTFNHHHPALHPFLLSYKEFLLPGILAHTHTDHSVTPFFSTLPTLLQTVYRGV